MMASKKRLINATEYCLELYKERDYPGRTQEFMDAIDVAIADLCDMPTVDAVEVVHGRWEKGEADKHGNRKPMCSVCGEYHLAWWSDYTHCKYCPNCGAKMDGERKDNV